jgi:hypothetical protein
MLCWSRRRDEHPSSTSRGSGVRRIPAELSRDVIRPSHSAVPGLSVREGSATSTTVTTLGSFAGAVLVLTVTTLGSFAGPVLVLIVTVRCSRSQMLLDLIEADPVLGCHYPIYVGQD